MLLHRWIRSPGPARSPVVATTRVRELLGEVVPNVWVGSSKDPREMVEASQWVPPADLCVLTRGEEGGSYWCAEGREHTYPASPLPAPPVDAYGCGDSFAGALAYAVGMGLPTKAAVQLAARCGAACRSGRGPYAGQLRI